MRKDPPDPAEVDALIEEVRRLLYQVDGYEEVKQPVWCLIEKILYGTCERHLTERADLCVGSR